MSHRATSIPEVFNIPSNCRERFLPLRLPTLAPLRQFGVEVGGISEIAPPYEIGRPDPPFHLLVATLEGEVVCRTEDGDVIMQPGDTWVLPAGRGYHYAPGGHWLLAWLHLTDIDRWRLLRSETPQRLEFPFQTQLFALMEGVLAEVLLPEEKQALTLPSYARLITAMLERMLERFNEPRAARAFQTLRRLKEAIAAQPAYPWNNNELASLFNTSVSGLRRIIHPIEQKSPMDIVTDLRMQQVQELLHSTNYTLDRIAGLVGYATPFALSRVFKQHLGVSPQAYRDALAKT